MTDRWKARWLLLGLTAAVTLPAAAWAQTPAAPPVSPPIEYPPPPPPETGAPPPEAPPQEAPPPVPPPPVLPPPQPPEGPVPGNVPTTWGPTEPEESVVEAASRGPIARPRLSGAVGMGSSFDSVGFSGGTEAVPTFVGVLGIGDGLLGLDLGTFATSATRAQRQADSPVDRVAVDLYGVVRPGALHRRDDRSFEMRVLHSLAAELGLGLERAGRSNISGTRFLIHLGATVDVPLTPASEATELRLRLGVRRNVGLYTPKLYGNTTSDVTDVVDTAAEVYAALAVVF
jgi:hypothetical protein